MKTKNSRSLFFAVDPCKRIDTNEHKENSYLQLNCCGSLEVINTKHKKRNLYKKITIAELLSRVQTQGLWKAEGYRHKENTTKFDCCGP